MPQSENQIRCLLADAKQNQEIETSIDPFTADLADIISALTEIGISVIAENK